MTTPQDGAAYSLGFDKAVVIERSSEVTPKMLTDCLYVSEALSAQSVRLRTMLENLRVEACQASENQQGDVTPLIEKLTDVLTALDHQIVELDGGLVALWPHCDMSVSSSR